jgi:hypothetical protein
MNQIFTRLYATEADADSVVARLKNYGLRDQDIQMTRPGGDAAATEASILKGHVLKRLVPTYAAGVAKGGTLLSVYVWPGNGVPILRIVESGNPIDDGLPKPKVSTWEKDDPSPFSDVFGFPTLIDEKPRGFGFPLLSGTRGAYKPVIPLPTLSGTSGPYNPVIPMPTLSNTSGPYRAVIPMPLLAGNGPSIPIPTLTNNNGGYKPIIPLALLTR